MDLKTPGNWLYLVGDFRPTWGGSYFSQLFGVPDDAPELTLCVPAPSSNAPAVYAALHQAICQGLVRACHDLSEGGLSVAAAEMCLAGRLGLHIDLDRLTPKPQDPLLTLFGETNGCLLVEVRATDADAFESLLAGLPTQRIGQVSAELFLKVLSEGFEPLILPVNSLVTAFSTPHATEAK
jgi:phosphoribosylformylglycinamidine synthase